MTVLLRRVAPGRAGLFGSRLFGSLLLGVLAIAFLIGLAAGPARAQAAHTQDDGPALWVIRDADSTLYLFGTIHVLRPETRWRTPRIEAAYAASSELWLEVENPDDASALVPAIQRHGFATDRPLSLLLNAEERNDLDAAARAIGASAAQMEPMRPWLAALTLSVAPAVRAGYDPASGVEMVLGAQAREDGKPVRGLETLEQQVEILAGLDEADQLDFLRTTLREFDRAVEVLDRMSAAWASGDVDTLRRMAVEEFEAEAPAAYEAILARRNADWADQIQTLLAGSGTVFIAVGAAHLIGDDSVQAILVRRGVTAERVTD